MRTENNLCQEIKDREDKLLMPRYKLANDRAKLIVCLENVREGVQSIGLLDYINRALEEVNK